MPSEDALAFHSTVYHVAQQCPAGSVTTYGHLAYVAGKPNNSRQAGQALKVLSRSLSSHYNIETVPWWRVVGASGRVTNVEHRDEQRQRLQEEIGVEEPYNMAKLGWFPDPDDIDLDFHVD